jgi:Protein of unknown function (DUF3761)
MELRVTVLALLLVMLGACGKEEAPAPSIDTSPPPAAPADNRPPPPLPPVVPAPLPAPLPKPTPRPSLPPVATTPGNTDPTGATAKCKDGTNRKHSGACSHHGGVSTWLTDDLPSDGGGGSKPPKQPTSPAAKPEAPPPVTESAVDKFLEQLPKGSAVFTAPGQADQYRPFDVTLRLENRELGAMIADARSRSPDEVSEGVSGIHMSDRMRAELIGADFIPSGEKTIQEQPSSVIEGTTWKWQVHSDTPGKHQLTARIETLMNIDGKDSWRTIDVAEVSIDIKINEIGWAMNNWKWIATAIVLPLIGWFAKRKFADAGKGKDS